MPRAPGSRNDNRDKRRRPNQGDRTRRPLLNLGRIDYFKYDLNEIINGAKIDDNLVGSFKATIIAKSSKISIQAAKDYINEVQGREGITKETGERISRLLDRYTMYR